jgi:aspartyl-tRNA(Asn)/glutamyl-tRNA(Gln) amidotransferase subunit C
MSMQIDKETVRHVAELARLKLTPKEIAQFQEELKDVLEAFSKIDEVDVKGTKPSFQPIELKNAMRDDEPGKCLSQDEALANSAHNHDGYIKGPKAV